MKERYIPPFIMLLAAAITSIINILNHEEVNVGLKRLLIVIIIFYFIGILIKTIVKIGLKKFSKKEQPEENNENQEETVESNKPEEKKS